MFYFPVIVMASIYIYYKKSMKRVILAWLCILLSLGSILSPWIIRNYTKTNRVIFATAPGFISPTRGSIMNKIDHTGEKISLLPRLIGRASLRYFFGTGTVTFFRLFDASNRFYRDYMPAEHAAPLDEIHSRFYIKENHYLKRNPVRYYIHLARSSQRFAVVEALFLAVMLAIYALAAAGVYFAFREGKVKESMFMIVPILYFAAVILIAITANSGHRFQSAPFYCILAGYGLNRLISGRRTLKKASTLVKNVVL